MSDGQFPDGIGSDDVTYEPQDAIGKAIKNGAMLGGAGLFLAAVQNTVAKQNVGMFGIFSKFGSSTALFAGMGGAYAFVSSASANLRTVNDPINQFWGGFAAGAVAGLRKRTFPSLLGNGLALGVVLGVASFSGAAMFGTPDMHPQEGRWPTKEDLRKRFSRPINETINELGEGRGIYGEGYDERRKQRIKDNHGIEVTDPYWETKAEAQPMRMR